MGLLHLWVHNASSTGMTAQYLCIPYPDKLQLSMPWLLVSLLLHQLFIVSLVFGLLCDSSGMAIIASFIVSASVRYFSCFLGTECRALFCWCLKRAVTWITFFYFGCLCSPTTVSFYSFSRLISPISPSWSGKHIMSASGFFFLRAYGCYANEPVQTYLDKLY